MLQFKFEKIGPIEEGEIEIKNLTVLCGENNTGKTYASYSIYGFLKELRLFSGEYPTVDHAELEASGQLEIDLNQTINTINERIESLSEQYTKKLYKIFSVHQGAFSSAMVTGTIDLDKFKDYVLERTVNFTIWGEGYEFDVEKASGALLAEVDYSLEVSDDDDEKKETQELFRRTLTFDLDDVCIDVIKQPVFLLPAERSGLNLFFKELNAARNELVHMLGVGMVNDELRELGQRLQQVMSPYPVPLSDYLTFLNRFDTYTRKESQFADLARQIQKQIIKGTYEVQDQQIFYKNQDGNAIHLHVSSSTVKSLFGLVFYLTYMAKKNQYLIIDEPELNLHPDNQRKLAKILAQVANRGVRVILSTHSDYIIKEFNSLLMLSKLENRQALMEKYGYEEEQLLQPENVGAYLFIDSRIEPMPIDPLEGIIAETFDKVINENNEAADAIYYSLQDELESREREEDAN